MRSITRHPRFLGWTSFVVAACLFAISVAFEWQARSDFGWVGAPNVVSTVVSGLLYAAVGALIIDRLGSHRVGWLFCAAGIGWAVPSMAGSAAEYARLAPGHFWGEGILIWAGSWSPYIAFGSVPVLMLFVFPNGALPAPKWRPFMAIAVLGLAAGIVGASLAPGPYIDHPAFENIFGIGGVVGGVMRFLELAAWPVFIVSMIGGVGSTVTRMRVGTEKERQQIKWILFAGASLVVFVLFWGVMSLLGNEALAQRWRGWALGVVPVAVGIAVLKHRLYDIDVVINRALVYGTLTAVLAISYLGLVVLMQQVLSPLTTDSDLAVAASTLAVAGLFRPLRERVQRFIDRRFYRRKYDAASTLGDFSSRLRDQVDLDSLGRELVAVVGTTMQPAHASLWLRSDAEAAP